MLRRLMWINCQDCRIIGRIRVAKEIVDIMLLITTLDEKKLLSQLPQHVVDNTDSIPTLKLEDGELNFFIRKA